MSWFVRCLVFGMLAACGNSISLELTERGQGSGSGEGSAEVAAGYSRPATPADLPDGFPFAPPVGPDEVGGSGEATAPRSLCDDGIPAAWEPRCGAGLCVGCETDAACGAGLACRSGACLPATLPEATLELLPERAAQLFGAPARLASFWAEMVRDGQSVRRFFAVRRETATDTKLSFDVYRQQLSETGEALPEGSGELVLDERWVGGFADGSLLREALSQQAIAVLTGQPMGSGEHWLVTVNGQTYGPMFIFREADDAALLAAGRSADAPRFVADGSGEIFASGGGALVPLPAGRYAEAFVEESSSADDFAPLASLVEGAVAVDAAAQAAGSGAGACAVRRVLDVNGYLDGLAALALLGDGGHARANYRLSLQPSAGSGRRWEVWYDNFGLSFGCLWNEADNNALCGGMDASLTAYSGVFEGDASAAAYPVTQYFNLLTDVVLRDPELERAFGARICDMLDSAYWSEALPRQIAGLGALLEPSASVDPRDRLEGADGYRAELDALLAYHADRTRLLRSQFLCF